MAGILRFCQPVGVEEETFAAGKGYILFLIRRPCNDSQREIGDDVQKFLLSVPDADRCIMSGVAIAQMPV